MSDLVGNPEDRFSCVAAHISSTMKYLLSFAFANTCKTQLGHLSMNKDRARGYKTFFMLSSAELEI